MSWNLENSYNLFKQKTKIIKMVAKILNLFNKKKC